MFFNTYPPKLAQKDGGSIASRIKEMMAFVISPAGRQAPAREELARLTSPANKYCTGVVELLEATVSLFAAKSVGGNAGSGLARPGAAQGVQGLDKPDGPIIQVSDTPFGDVFGLIDDYMEDLEQEPEEPEDWAYVSGDALGQADVNRAAHVSDLPAIAPLVPRRASQALEAATPDAPEDDLVGMIDDFLQDLEDEPMQPAALVVNEPILSTVQSNPRTARYASHQTLPVPIANSPEPPLPTIAELRTRRLMYKLDRVRFKQLHYTPCELAHRGVYLHHQVGHSEHADPDFNRARPQREAWVGPLKRHRVWAGQEMGRPRLELTPPSDVDEPMVNGASVDGASSSESPRPVTLVGAQVPTKPVILPVSSSRPPTQPSRSLERIEPARDTPAAQLARKMRGRPSSMCEWLAQFGSGLNVLVDESIVASASPVINAVLAPSSPSPSSPSSSSPPSPLLVSSALSSPRSSPPTTPASSPETSFVVLAHDNQSVRSSIGHRRRARCSYDGGKFDEVVAPVLPEELLTDEVGVAC